MGTGASSSVRDRISDLTASDLSYAPKDMIAHTIAFVSPVVDHWLE